MLAGNTWINAHNVFPHGVPYGGIGKSGLGGGVNTPETLFDYWRSQSSCGRCDVWQRRPYRGLPK